jgi:hypothetical protein
MGNLVEKIKGLTGIFGKRDTEEYSGIIVESLGVHDMSSRFIDSFYFTEKRPQIMAFLHSAGLEVYGSQMQAKENAFNYFKSVLEMSKQQFVGYKSVLAMIWAIREIEISKIINFFGVGSPDMPGRPYIDSWTIKNELPVGQKEGIPGDTIPIVGREEERIRKSRSLDEYFSNNPHKYIHIWNLGAR